MRNRLPVSKERLNIHGPPEAFINPPTFIEKTKVSKLRVIEKIREEAQRKGFTCEKIPHPYRIGSLKRPDFSLCFVKINSRLVLISSASAVFVTKEGRRPYTQHWIRERRIRKADFYLIFRDIPNWENEFIFIPRNEILSHCHVDSKGQIRLYVPLGPTHNHNHHPHLIFDNYINAWHLLAV